MTREVIVVSHVGGAPKRMSIALILLTAACTPPDKNARRGDVQAFIEEATKNGHRMELNGDTIRALGCTSMPSHFPPIPLDITLECVDGYKGVVWKREGPSSDRPRVETPRESSYVLELRKAGFAPKGTDTMVRISADCKAVRRRFDAELKPPAGVTVSCDTGWDGEEWRVKN